MFMVFKGYFRIFVIYTDLFMQRILNNKTTTKFSLELCVQVLGQTISPNHRIISQRWSFTVFVWS